MKRNLLLFVAFLLVNTLLTAQIMITEISYNPPESGNDSLEYIELYNNSGAVLNIEGYNFTAGVEHTFPSMEIASDSYIVVCVNDTAMMNTFGITAIQWESGALKNGGESIELSDSNGVVIDFVEFGDKDPWPTSAEGTDGGGASIELCDLASDNELASSWGVSQTNSGVVIDGKDLLGSPGAANSSVCGPPVLTGDYTVVASGTVFTPSDLTIQVGETVLWDNQSGPHNVNGSLATFPNNPEGFHSGDVAQAPWMFNFKFTIPGVYQYQCDPHAGAGMTGTITVLAEPEPEYPLRDIAIVNQEDANGVATYLDSLATLEAIVYGANLNPAGLQFAIVDDGGNGIGVYSQDSNLGYSYAEGDKIQVLGKIEQFAGLTQIRAVEVVHIDSGNDLLDATIVTALDETTESILVQLRDLILVDESQWKEPGNSFNVTVSDGNNEYQLRIDNDVLIDKPNGVFHITGIGGQYDTESPHDSGYQLFPRYASDVELVSNVTNINANGSFTISPNPTTQSLTIDSEIAATSYEIYDMNGRMISTSKYQSNIDVSNLENGMYIIRLKDKSYSYNTTFIKH